MKKIKAIFDSIYKSSLRSALFNFAREKHDIFQVVNLIMVLFILLVVPVVVVIGIFSARERQKAAKRAFGLGGINVTLSPSGSSFKRGDSFVVTVNLTNTLTAQQIFNAGVDINFDTNVFDASSPTCGTNLPVAVPTVTPGPSNRISLTCTKYDPLAVKQTALTINNGQTLVLGSFKLTVKATAPFGATSLTFPRGVIPDANYTSVSDVTNLATLPDSVGYTIAEPPTLTPTPTVTSIPSPTPTKAPTLTPTATRPPTPTLTRAPTNIPTPTPTKRVPPGILKKTPTPTPTIRPTVTPTARPTAIPT